MVHSIFLDYWQDGLYHSWINVWVADKTAGGKRNGSSCEL